MQIHLLYAIIFFGPYLLQKNKRHLYIENFEVTETFEWVIRM